MSSDKVVKIEREAESLVDAVAREMGSRELTQAAVAREAGVHSSALNRWLKGAYTGDNEALAAKMRRWLDTRQSRRLSMATLPAAPDWVETPSARQILSALSYAQLAGDIATVYGGAGVGKTLTARHYRTSAPNVWITTMTPATAVVGSALERVALTLGLRPAGRASRVEGDIIERMRDTQGLLVVDEAQHLGPRALDAMRALHDATGVGVTFMGNEIVYAQLTGNTRSIGFAQLFSRIGKRVRLTRPRAGDVDALIDAWGVHERDAANLLREIAKKPGALRGVTKTLRLASMFAAGDGVEQPTLGHIRVAWRDLGGE